MATRRSFPRHAGTWTVLACLCLGAVGWRLGAAESPPASARPTEPVLALMLAREVGAEPVRELQRSPPRPPALEEALESHGQRDFSMFLAEEARSPGTLDARESELLAEATSDAVRLAFVAARLRLGTPRRTEGILELLRSKTQPSTPKGESLAGGLVRILGNTAKEDPEVRNMLRRIAFEEQPLSHPVRVRAAREFARLAAGADLAALRRHLARETDPLLLSGALQGLAENPDVERARSIAAELGVELPALEGEPEP